MAHPKGTQREARRVLKVTKTRPKIGKMRVADRREEEQRPKSDLGCFLVDCGSKKVKTYKKREQLETSYRVGSAAESRLFQR